jgi:hypothetical protein
MDKPFDVLWSDADVEKRWQKKPGYMSDLRAKGQGPSHLRLSAKVVRYRPEDVIAYEEAQRFQTAAEGQASDYKAPVKAEPSKSVVRLPARPGRDSRN